MTHPDQPNHQDPAVTIVGLLTGALAGDRDLPPADRDEAIAITQAMLLLGSPLRSDGKLTIKTLAEEAGPRRNKLTHKHTGLKDLFYALVRTHNNQPAALVELREENARLRSTVSELRRTNHEPTARSNASPASCTSWKSKTSNSANTPPLHGQPPAAATCACCTSHRAAQAKPAPARSTHPTILWRTTPDDAQQPGHPPPGRIAGRRWPSATGAKKAAEAASSYANTRATCSPVSTTSRPYNRAISSSAVMPPPNP
jgi:hypothetical protein